VEDVVLSLYYADGQAAAERLGEETPDFTDGSFNDEQVLKHHPLFPLKKKTEQRVQTESDALLEK
jgi:hypothetical protein